MGAHLLKSRLTASANLPVNAFKADSGAFDHFWLFWVQTGSLKGLNRLSTGKIARKSERVFLAL
jgi:hypothetical protein